MIRQPNDSVPLSTRVFAVVVVAATVVSSGYFTVSGLVDPGGLVPGGDAHAARVYAAYMSVRSIVVLGALLACAAVRAWRALALVLALNGVVQVGDAVLGVVQRQIAQSVGPACFAAALFAAGWWLTRRSRRAGKIGPGKRAADHTRPKPRSEVGV
jgi:hypothetical protein